MHTDPCADRHKQEHRVPLFSVRGELSPLAIMITQLHRAEALRGSSLFGLSVCSSCHSSDCLTPLVRCKPCISLLSLPFEFLLCPLLSHYHSTYHKRVMTSETEQQSLTQRWVWRQFTAAGGNYNEPD